MPFNFGGSSSQRPYRNNGNSNYAHPESSVHRPNGSGNVPNHGFQDRPEVRPERQQPERYGPPTQRRNRGRHRMPGRSYSIPWNIIVTIMAIAVILILCWTFRDLISAVLAQIFAWVIIILIIIYVIKKFLFPNKK